MAIYLPCGDKPLHVTECENPCITPSGALVIGENGTYNIANYETVIVNVIDTDND